MQEVLVKNFLRISGVPRGSGYEEKIADFFVNIAKENNLYYYKDENNNVLIKKKGSIDSAPVAIQAHLDMVCVKRNNSKHDFYQDGIEVIIAGDKVTAKDTSLGADQGVGLAIMLTLMEDKVIKHPDLEFILTVEEETTFKGAITFPYAKVASKRLINLDYCKDDAVVIGSDGDILNAYTFEGKLTFNNLPGYRILIDGFPGGNSGSNIDLSKDNAITTMANILKDKDIYLKSIDGGTFENDIATSCEVVINTNLDVESIFYGLNAKIEKVDNKYIFSKEDTANIIREILELKCGYIGGKDASGNLGTIKTTNDKVEIQYIFRSIDLEELENINNNSKELNNGFEVSEIYRDSIWKVNEKSDLLDKYKNVYYKEYNKYPKEMIGHGGLECASIKKRIDGVDIISIGANMKNYHTINEVTYISSWVKVYRLLTKFLENL